MPRSWRMRRFWDQIRGVRWDAFNTGGSPPDVPDTLIDSHQHRELATWRAPVRVRGGESAAGGDGERTDARIARVVAGGRAGRGQAT